MATGQASVVLVTEDVCKWQRAEHWKEKFVLMISREGKEVVSVDPCEHQSCCSNSFFNPYESEGANKPLYTVQIFLYHKGSSSKWVKVRFRLKDWTCRHASFTWILHVISNIDTQHIPTNWYHLNFTC